MPSSWPPGYRTMLSHTLIPQKKWARGLYGTRAAKHSAPAQCVGESEEVHVCGADD